MQHVDDGMALVTSAMARLGSEPDEVELDDVALFAADLERVMQGRDLTDYKVTAAWLAMVGASLISEMADLLGMAPDDLLADVALLVAQSKPAAD